MLWDGTYRFSSVSKKTRKTNRLQRLLQRQHFLLSYLKTLSIGPAGGFNPRPNHSADQQASLPTKLTRWWFSVTVKLKCVRWLNTVLAVCVYMSFAKSREWMITLFIHDYKHQSNRKLIKNSQKLFFIFAVWEYWSENHRWELLLKKTKEFDVRISSGRLLHRRAPL